ncbi:MAG: DUF1932 domain-containing protein [Litorimonas sp.]
MKIAIIGFGEAGQMFGRHLAKQADVHAYDVIQDQPMRANGDATGVTLCASLKEAVSEAEYVLSLVTADQAPIVAKQAGAFLNDDQYFLEMNSVAPNTKSGNTKHCNGLVDIAIMAPVYPKEAKVPLLLSHPNGEAITHSLNSLGLNVRCVGNEIGRAASIKMCRSVMIKGMEALTLECFQTARFYGVEEEIKSSLHGSFPGMGWDKDRVGYWFERVSTHGARRAEEMREVAKTVTDAQVKSKMAQTVADTFDEFIRKT